MRKQLWYAYAGCSMCWSNHFHIMTGSLTQQTCTTTSSLYFLCTTSTCTHVQTLCNAITHICSYRKLWWLCCGGQPVLPEPLQELVEFPGGDPPVLYLLRLVHLQVLGHVFIHTLANNVHTYTHKQMWWILRESMESKAGTHTWTS